MQPQFRFPGITDYISVRYTLSHGVQPGRIQVLCEPSTVNPSRFGDAEFFDPLSGVTVTMPDCVLDKPFFDRQTNGQTLVRFDILDQRWRWQFGQISGQWNVRNNDGSRIKEGTEKTPRQLLKMCCDALGIDRPDLSRVPNDARPYVNWDIANPAQSMASIADSIGCVVVLKPGGRVAIEQQGVGRLLPDNGFTLSGGAGFDPPELSHGVEFFAGPTLYQIDADLEAVGEDVNGEIRKIDDLSYKPKGGWSDVDFPKCMDVDVKFRDLAKKSVYRMYRIVPPEFLPGVPKKKENKVKELDELLPVFDYQVEADEFPDGSKKRRPAWVYGQFYKGKTTFPIVPPRTKVNPDLNKRPQDQYTRSFSVDRERGIVVFGDPVYLFNKQSQGYVTQPANIKVRLAVHWRHPSDRALVHWSKLLGRKSAKRQPTVINRADIAEERYENHAKKKVIDNLVEVEKQAKFYLSQTVESFKPKPIGVADYVGIWAIEPDGAIRQVSWVIETESAPASKTSASVNFDDPALDISYEEKRFTERLLEGVKQQNVSNQAKGAKP